MREIIAFNENWIFTKNGQSIEVKLPHTWNAEDGQDGGNDYYRGTCKYEKRFTLNTDKRVWLEFKGVACSARVAINGKEFTHAGGFSSFRVPFEAKGQNCVEVYVDNGDNRTVYPQKADFTFYGGIYRDVNLILTEEEHFELDYCGTPAIKVTPAVDLEKRFARVTVETWQNADKVTVSVDGQSKTVRSENGKATAVFDIPNVHLWDGVADPYMYIAEATLESGDKVEAAFGCRTFEIDAQKGFILNGRSYPLRGVAKHQDMKGAGNAISVGDMRRDMDIIKELGANTLRLAHYQHAQEFYDLCDKYGIIVWAEIPYITMHMPEGRANTLTQMEELIVQNYNHPSIIVWGLSNEITSASPVSDDLLENHRLLNELCHRLDSTRPTTMANVFMLETDSPILDIPDVNSYNLYYGWYLGELQENDKFFDDYHAKYPERPIGFSEYGADANPALHSPTPEKGDYTEEYQCVYHEHIINMIEKRPYLWATHVWNMFDFAADGRDEGGKHGENQKGLVTFDRNIKKDAFYLYKAHWNKNEKFVHICGRRYKYRTGGSAQIKVYSNLDEVCLYVDGKLAATERGQYVFTFDIPLTGEHKLTAKAGKFADEITVIRTEQPCADYILPQSKPVTNWFDQDLKPDYYSVNDKISDILQHPEAGAVVQKMMMQGAASRGDVATAAMNNPNLIRMMSRMTLSALLKQGGADEESVKQLNRILQNYKKV